jgi:hypothetical protein
MAAGDVYANAVALDESDDRVVGYDQLAVLVANLLAVRYLNLLIGHRCVLSFRCCALARSARPILSPPIIEKGRR